MTIIEPICMSCKHYDWDKNYCLAFPQGTPFEILAGENNHSKPLPGQGNNLVYEPIDKKLPV